VRTAGSGVRPALIRCATDSRKLIGSFFNESSAGFWPLPNPSRGAVKVIDASVSIEGVGAEIWKQVEALLGAKRI